MRWWITSRPATSRRWVRSCGRSPTPVWQSILCAPLDDEPETGQERAEVEAARKETGTGTTHEEVLREFGG
jgi:hypothetical protein